MEVRIPQSGMRATTHGPSSQASKRGGVELRMMSRPASVVPTTTVTGVLVVQMSLSVSLPSKNSPSGHADEGIGKTMPMLPTGPKPDPTVKEGSIASTSTV